MGLTKSKGNMYPWVTHTWNPIKGCGYACPYCYVQKAFERYGYDNTVRLDEKELSTKLGKDRTIFIGSMADMWGPWVSIAWIRAVLTHCMDFPFNHYVFQTKNPCRYNSVMYRYFYHLKGRVALGTTIETDQYPIGFESNAPSIASRYNWMIRLPVWVQKFITIEPIMDFRIAPLMNMILQIKPDFVTIGADSKGHGLVEPPWEKVERLVDALGANGIEIRQKKNLDRLKK